MVIFVYHVAKGLDSTWVGACYVMLCLVDLTPCVVISAIWPKLWIRDTLGCALMTRKLTDD